MAPEIVIKSKNFNLIDINDFIKEVLESMICTKIGKPVLRIGVAIRSWKSNPILNKASHWPAASMFRSIAR